METGSLLVHIWTIIPLVQCTDTISADTPVWINIVVIPDEGPQKKRKARQKKLGSVTH